MCESELGPLPPDQQHLVCVVTDRLAPRFAGTFGPETIERFVIDSLQRLLHTAKVNSFLPVLTERFAKDRLPSGRRMAPPPRW